MEVEGNDNLQAYRITDYIFRNLLTVVNIRIINIYKLIIYQYQSNLDVKKISTENAVFTLTGNNLTAIDQQKQIGGICL